MRARTASSTRSTTLSTTSPATLAPLVRGYKFAVGQSVTLSLPYVGVPQVDVTYTVVKLLPKEAGDPQYRVKSDTESYERVVRESQLQATAS